MYLTLVTIIAAVWITFELAIRFKPRRRVWHPSESSEHAKQLRRRLPNGAIAGSLCCILGLLGIYTYGLGFVPLAAVCGGFGLTHALSSRSARGLVISSTGVALTITAAVSSPSLATAIHPYMSEAAKHGHELAAYLLTTIQH